MTTTEVLRLLKGEGFTDATESSLRYAVLARYIDTPELNSSGIMVWTVQHVEQARDYFKSPRKRGRKPNGGGNGTPVQAR